MDEWMDRWMEEDDDDTGPDEDGLKIPATSEAASKDKCYFLSNSLEHIHLSAEVSDIQVASRSH